MIKKTTLSILISAAIVLFGAIKLDAQTVTASAIYYPDNGDTIIFHLNGYHGTVQWQKSNDSINWTDIVGATNDTLIALVDTNSYYRAVVTEGTCTPFYSENKKAEVIIINPKTYTVDTLNTILISDSTQISNGILYYIYNDTTVIDTSNIILDKNNNGYLRKVQSATLYGQNLSIDSKQATVSDVIKQIDLNDSLKITLSSKKLAYMNGIPVQGKVLYIADGVTLREDKSGGGLDISGTELLQDMIGGVNVSAHITNGYINFDPTINRELDIGLFTGINKFKLTAAGQLDYGADLQLSCDAPIVGIGNEIPLFVYECPYFIYGIPMFVKLTFVAGFSADLTVSGNVTTGGEGTANIEFGADYEKANIPQWSTVWNYNASFTQDPVTWSMNGNANAKVYVKAKISTKILDVAGPYLEARSYIDLDANLYPSPPSWDWALKGGVDGNLGFEVEILDLLLADYNTPLLNWEYTFASDNGSLTNYLPVALFTVSPTSGTPSTTFNFDASGCSDVETSSANIQVRWDWNNDGTFDTPYSMTKTTTHQYTIAGNYTVKLEALDGDGNTNFTTYLVKVLDPTQTPAVTTNPATNVLKTTANLHGEVTSLGGSAVSQYGHCWAVTAYPTVANNHSSLGSKTTTGNFMSSIIGLLPATKYYFRAYATNTAGTVYGSQLYFTTLPTITPSVNTTDLVYNINDISATVDGTVGDFSGGTITEHGVCWATTQNPTTSNFKILLGSLSSPGSFTSNLNSLIPSTTYYVRTFAINNAGISYGNQLSFTTATCSCPPTITDIDGNIYNTVQIGSQCWMKENLKVTHFRNGDLLSNITDSATWRYLSTGAYCWYNNDSVTYANNYGALYNWYAVTDSRNISPSGWHMPTHAELHTLALSLDSNGVSDTSTSNIIGGKLKEIGTTHWLSPNTGATNESSFTALPGGVRAYGGFKYVGTEGIWWSSTANSSADAWVKSLYYNNSYLYITIGYKTGGFSVRCVLDTTTTGYLPTITTNSIINIVQNTATGGGNITNDGGSPITAKGVCWSTNQSPMITDNITTDGTGIGNFTSTLTGLSANITYYVRAYATNSFGTAYGNQLSFTTASCNCPPTVTDIDGNVYNTVQIGCQCWMKENLKVTHYRNGDAIPNVTDNTQWSNLTAGAYCGTITIRLLMLILTVHYTTGTPYLTVVICALPAGMYQPMMNLQPSNEKFVQAAPVKLIFPMMLLQLLCRALMKVVS